jgi:SAM-dependent methyltransferase
MTAPPRRGWPVTKSRGVKRSPSADAARLGEPSYVWRSGQERRLQLIRDQIPLEGRWILDVGCGIGTYVRRFRDLSSHVFGLDVSAERLSQAGIPGLVAGEGEALPFAAGSFDVIVFNEVIEHVRDDRRTIQDALRALREGGHIVIYAPNRLYPFETHGIYVRGRYKFGNIPLVNYLPDRYREKLVPHARAYRARDIARLWEDLPVRLLVHGYVYPGFDNVAARHPALGKALRASLYRAERTPIRRFGLSHFVVLEKVAPRRGTIEAGVGHDPARSSILQSHPSA